MEQLTSVTGSRHNRSTAASRSRAMDRAARLGAFENKALALTRGARLRISAAAPYVLVTVGMVIGSLNWK